MAEPETAVNSALPKPFEDFRSFIDSIPEPEPEENPVLRAATFPAKYAATTAVKMLKSTVHSVLNLMEAGHGDRPVSVEDTTNVAGLGFGMGQVPGIYPVGSIGVFGSRINPASPLHTKLNAAVSKFGPENLDLDPIETLRSTGLSKDYNGNWVYETDDSKASLHPMTPELAARVGTGEARLPEILNHPELFEAFSYLNEVRVRPDEPGFGSYTHEARSMSADVFDLPTVLHEAQHAVQQHEFVEGVNRPTGSSPQSIPNQLTRLNTILGELKNRGAISQEELTKVGSMFENFRTNFEVYQANPGEVEARNVEMRIPLTEEGRRSIPPDYTEDVPRGQQVDLSAINPGPLEAASMPTNNSILFMTEENTK